MADAAAINSPDYWNRRFASDWTARGGAEQTEFFAKLAAEMLPEWFWRQANQEQLSFLDMGCALGEALPVFQERMPESTVVGLDVADVAIRMAGVRLPAFHFQTIAADWSDAPQADIVFCSNTLEHFEDWQTRLASLGALANQYVVLLTPFQERQRIDEHVTSFDFGSFPAQLPGAKRLIYFRLDNTAERPQSRWPGLQALALYGPRSKTRRALPDAPAPYAGVDLRGLTAAQITQTMLSLQQGEPVAPDEVAPEPIAPEPLTPDVQTLLSRVNDEWQERFAIANAEYLAKHGELTSHYERALAERDATITAFDRLMALTIELERTKTICEQQGAELAREREQNQELRMALRALPDAQAQASELAALRFAAEDRNNLAAALESEIERLKADVAAAKAALFVVIEERDLARKSVPLPPQQVTVVESGDSLSASAQAEIEHLKAELGEVSESAEASRQEVNRLRAEALEELESFQNAIAGLKAEKDRHERNADDIRRHYEEHLSALNVRLAQFVEDMAAELERARAAGQADLNHTAEKLLSARQYAQDLRAMLELIMASKSWSLAMRLRRLYFAARGQFNPGILVTPSPPAEPQERSGSEWLARLDAASAVLAQVGEENPAGASVQAGPAVAANRTERTAVQTERASQRGPALAMQVETLSNGGLERVVFDLCIGLRRRGTRVIVIAVSSGGPIAHELRERGVEVFEIVQDLAAYEQVLRNENVNDLFLHHSYFGIEHAAQAGVRLYDVVHNYYFWLKDETKLVRRAADRCARIVYVSSAVRDFHERLFGVPRDKGIVINNPAHLDGLILPDRRQLLRLRQLRQETVFLNVAQAYPAKAQAAMITAFARAHRGDSGVRLQIAGGEVRDDAAQALRRRIDEEALGEAVELLGYCDRRTMSRLYAQAHAFVLPSIYEGYSISAIEAAAYGLPLIMTDVGGARDLIDNGGCGIVLPPPIADLTKPRAEEIDRLGLARENAATSALAAAFAEIAAHRSAWTGKGLDASFKIQSLDDAVDAYLSLTEAAAIAGR